MTDISDLQTLRGVEIRHLRYFIGAVENGSLRRASIALKVQELTISRAVRDLEDRLGASLFHRQVGGVCLTIAGEHFLKRTRIILQQLEDGVRDVSAVGRCEVGRIKVGIFSSIASGFLANLLRTYGSNYATVMIDLIDGNPTEHVSAVRRLGLDVAFITGIQRWRDCETTALWSERVFVALPDDHVLAANSELDWSDLIDARFIVGEATSGKEIHKYLVQRFACLGCHPEIVVQRIGRDNLLSLVAAGRGLTIVSEAMTVARLPGVSYRPMAGEVIPYSAVWSQRNDNPALRRLLSMARQMSCTAAS